MSDEEARQLVAQITDRLDAILVVMTKLYDQTGAAMWERQAQEPKPPARQVTDEEYHQLQVQRYRDY